MTAIRDFLDYDLLRGLHIISVIAWMAAMLMLPRFFAYQSESARGGELERQMIDASRRLMTIIMNPAMIATWVFGLLLLWKIGFVTLLQPWLAIKFALVLVLSGIHGVFSRVRKQFAAGARPKSSRYWRLMNEVPFVIAIIVVLMATVQPMFGL
jgi:protoporphyrinogen IX oxidase